MLVQSADGPRHPLDVDARLARTISVIASCCFSTQQKIPSEAATTCCKAAVGIGSGEACSGWGYYKGQLTKLRFIPEQHTDFIFSALGEETGFLGTILVVVRICTC